MEKVCALCGRKLNSQGEKHHLKPKSKNNSKNNKVVLLHPLCHKMIHLLFTNKQLFNSYDNIKALRQSPKIQQYFEWINTTKTIKLLNRKCGVGKYNLHNFLGPERFYRPITSMFDPISSSLHQRYNKMVYEFKRFKRQLSRAGGYKR